MNQERRLFLDYGDLIVNYDFNRETLSRAHSLALHYINSLNTQKISIQGLQNAHNKAVQAYLAARQKDNSEWQIDRIMSLMLSELGLSVSVSEISDIYKFNDHDSTPKSKAILTLERLSHHAELGIISNLPHDSILHELKAYGISELFNPVVISYQVGFRKPHPAIYQEAIRRANSKPENCIFISHDAEEVKGAENVGIRGILVKSLKEVIGKL